jgi:hypothetical protein
VNQDISGTGNPLLDGVTRAWDLLIQQIDDILGWTPPSPPGLRRPQAMSDGELRAALRAVATGLIGTIDATRRAGRPAPGDPRWRFNLPATVETLVPAMFAEASDAFGLAVAGLDDQASAASLGVVGRLAETQARARWLLEPSDAGQRRERAYALADEAISRVTELSGRVWEADGGDRADLAGEIADRGGTMAARLAELRVADGLGAVRVPKRRKLLQAYVPEGVELFALMSAADSHPAATASGLFYTEPGTGDALRGFRRQHLTRGYWLAQAITLYADVCTVSGSVMGRPDWEESVATAAAGFRPLCEEAGRRYRQRLRRGLHPGL